MSPVPTRGDLERIVKEKKAADRRAVTDFIGALLSGDSAALSASIRAVHDQGQWDAAFRRAGRLPDVPASTRTKMLDWWLSDGDLMREWVEDVSLFDFLRATLPPYEGGPMRLFRGDACWNRRRRKYGPSWSADRKVADGFAQGAHRMCAGGSVLLEALVPAAAILCAPVGCEIDEAEYIVDRRRIGRVTVLARYSQMTLAQHQTLEVRCP